MTAYDNTSFLLAVRTLEIIDYVAGYLLESFGNWHPLSEVNESVVLVELVDFYLLCILPASVAVLSVDPHSLFVTPWDLNAVLVFGALSMSPEFDLIGHSGQDLDVTDVTFAVLPTRCAKEAVPLCVKGHRYGVVLEDGLIVDP